MKDERYGDVELSLYLKKDGVYTPFEGTKVDMYLQREIIVDGQYKNSYEYEYENCYVYLDQKGNEYIEVSDSPWRYFWEFEKPILVLIPLEGRDLEIINARYERRAK